MEIISFKQNVRARKPVFSKEAWFIIKYRVLPRIEQQDCGDPADVLLEVLNYENDVSWYSRKIASIGLTREQLNHCLAKMPANPIQSSRAMARLFALVDDAPPHLMEKGGVVGRDELMMIAVAAAGPVIDCILFDATNSGDEKAGTGSDILRSIVAPDWLIEASAFVDGFAVQPMTTVAV